MLYLKNTHLHVFHIHKCLCGVKTPQNILQSHSGNFMKGMPQNRCQASHLIWCRRKRIKQTGHPLGVQRPRRTLCRAVPKMEMIFSCAYQPPCLSESLSYVLGWWMPDRADGLKVCEMKCIMSDRQRAEGGTASHSQSWVENQNLKWIFLNMAGGCNIHA